MILFGPSASKQLHDSCRRHSFHKRRGRADYSERQSQCIQLLRPNSLVLSGPHRQTLYCRIADPPRCVYSGRRPQSIDAFSRMIASGAGECAWVFSNAGADPNAVNNPQHQFYELMDDFECYVRRLRMVQVPPLHLAAREPDIKHIGAITQPLLDVGTIY